MLYRVARLALAAPRRVVASAIVVLIGAAIFGAPVADSLSAGGFDDPSSESAQAAKLLTDKFGKSDQQLVVIVTSEDGASSTESRQVGLEIAENLGRSPYVHAVSSAWTLPPGAASDLVSKDGKSGLVIADLNGGEREAPKHAKTLAEGFVYDRAGITVRSGGSSLTYAEVTDQSERDLVLMESIAMPLSFAVLVWVFGGLIAAALPLMVGILAIVGTMSVLRLISFGTEVSIFALNLTTALGFALAIDYTLLIVSRYREELAGGAARDKALIKTVTTTGRTVLFSAVTIMLSMSVMVLFPMSFLKSFAYAGVATVLFASIVAVVVTPAALVLLGPRLEALDVRRFLRRAFRLADPVAQPIEKTFWYRWTKAVMHRAVPVGICVTAMLVLLGVPFGAAKWGISDDRVLPATASAHEVGDALRTDFGADPSMAVSVVVPDATGVSPNEVDRYASDLSRVPDVSSVTAPLGKFVNGTKVGPPSGPAGWADGSLFLTVASTAPLFSDASVDQLDRLHAVALPAGKPIQVAGWTQVNQDVVGAVVRAMPLVLGLIGVITFVLLFLLTGSVVLPVKALVLNVLSLSATFGALVWIFQEGHVGAFGTTPTGTLVVTIPVLLFCIAFGMSMDYEVFLMARIREHWLVSARTDVANAESVALGLARTGKVITAAALVMSISFAALIATNVSFMRMFGVGLALAVLMDATLVRAVLVPAFMQVMGRANWWAPKALVSLHERVGLSEESPRV
jgi:RND superfamily putative drug exporter